MGTKNNSKLFYTCSLIEFIGRKMKRSQRSRDYIASCYIKGTIL